MPIPALYIRFARSKQRLVGGVITRRDKKARYLTKTDGTCEPFQAFFICSLSMHAKLIKNWWSAPDQPPCVVSGGGVRRFGRSQLPFFNGDVVYVAYATLRGRSSRCPPTVSRTEVMRACLLSLTLCVGRNFPHFSLQFVWRTKQRVVPHRHLNAFARGLPLVLALALQVPEYT